MEVRACERPYRHWLLSGVVPPELVAAARASVPAADNPAWVRYDNALEKKWAIEDRAGLPPAWNALLDALEAPPLVAELAALVGVPDLRPDPSRRGAGLHLMFPGGRLGTHIDYAMHPSGLERRVNLILFLGEFDMGHGGALELCDPGGRPEMRVYPGGTTPVGVWQSEPGRVDRWYGSAQAVSWECGDHAYHGVTPLTADAPPRLSAAVYFLAEPRPGCTRRRALFLPPR